MKEEPAADASLHDVAVSLLNDAKLAAESQTKAREYQRGILLQSVIRLLTLFCAGRSPQAAFRDPDLQSTKPDRGAVFFLCPAFVAVCQDKSKVKHAS